MCVLDIVFGIGDDESEEGGAGDATVMNAVVVVGNMWK